MIIHVCLCGNTVEQREDIHKESLFYCIYLNEMSVYLSHSPECKMIVFYNLKFPEDNIIISTL
jgi:hypothetical protein